MSDRTSLFRVTCGDPTNDELAALTVAVLVVYTTEEPSLDGPRDAAWLAARDYGAPTAWAQ